MGKMVVFGALVALTLVVYGVLVTVVGPPMQAMANGVIPDLRLTGYTVAEIQALLSGAEPGFAEAYARVATTWDRAFPILITLTLGYGIWIGGLPKIFILAPILMGLADLGENTLVAALFLGGEAALDAQTVRIASVLTMAKWLLFPISVLLLIIGFVRKRREQQTRSA